jgi:hypothetical protein
MLGLILVTVSAGIFVIHYAIFHDSHHIFIYMLHDLAFVPIEVLLVSLIIHRLLGVRERRSLMNKLNMVIGVFFSEVGAELIKEFVRMDPTCTGLGARLAIDHKWTGRKFAEMSAECREYEYDPSAQAADLEIMREFLKGKREFLLRLLENQNLLEHESFTDLLWAVFHLMEELEKRDDIASLPETDFAHLQGDITRVQKALFAEWVAYMRHLRDNYPYLFSLAIRTNPFDIRSSPVVTS